MTLTDTAGVLTVNSAVAGGGGTITGSGTTGVSIVGLSLRSTQIWATLTCELNPSALTL